MVMVKLRPAKMPTHFDPTRVIGPKIAYPCPLSAIWNKAMLAVSST